jgi:hypothetical protein
MKIYYDEIKKEAEKKGISPFRLLKKAINYRDATEYEVKMGLCCERCKERFRHPFPNGDLKCNVIGLSMDAYAAIKLKCVCDKYGKEK